MDAVAPEEPPSDPLAERPSGDKLAILCSMRPMCYAMLRTLAALAAVLLFSFVVDALSFVASWLGQSAEVSFLTTGDLHDASDLAVLRGLRDGLPLDTFRAALCAFTLLVLVAVELGFTRNLPPGATAMRIALRGGLPWPVRWQRLVRYGRAARGFVISAGALAGLAVVAGGEWPQGSDWWYAVIALIFTTLCAWLVTGVARHGGALLLQVLPSSVDVSYKDVKSAEKLSLSEDHEEAERRWPRKPDLRLRAAASVVAAPPPPMKRRKDREREVWWTGTRTSVEALAIEFVVQALVEARSRGLVCISDWNRRKQRVVADLPLEEQPRGLAGLVAGYHREGLTPGRGVGGSLSMMLDDVAGVDQYANVIEMAWEDLEDAGVVERGTTDTPPRLSFQRLEAVIAAWPAESVGVETPNRTVVVTSQCEIEKLRKSVTRHLRHKRTTEVGSDNGLQMLFAPFLASSERAERKQYELPGEWVGAE